MKEKVLELSKNFDPLYGIEYDITDSTKGINILNRIVTESDNLIRCEALYEVEELFYRDIDQNFSEEIDNIKKELSLKSDEDTEEIKGILEDNHTYDVLPLFLQKISNVSFCYKTGFEMENSEYEYTNLDDYKEEFLEQVSKNEILENVGYKYIKTLSEAGIRGEICFIFNLDQDSIRNIISGDCDIEFSKFKIGLIDYDNGVQCIISELINQKIKIPFKHNDLIVDDAYGSYAALSFYYEDFLKDTEVKVISNN